MATQVSPKSAGGQPRPRYNTRSSIRHSLTLASMGRAIVDVIAKDTGSEKEKEKEKASKKASSRRSSVIQAPANRSSTENAPPIIKKKDKDATPEAKTITRNTKRLSAIKSTDIASSGEQSDLTSGNASASPQTISVRSRTTALRPRNSLANSALPKYRPKSAILDSGSAVKQPTSPPRIGMRRRVSSSTDGISDDTELRGTQSNTKEKEGRAISPLPQRAALKDNLTSAINVRPSTPAQKAKTPTQSSPLAPRHGSSARPTKTVKTSTTSSATRAAIPRPPSSASSSASPRTPVISAANPKKTPLSHSQMSTPSSTASHTRTIIPSPPASPLGHRSTRKTPGHVKSASMSVLSIGKSPSSPVILTQDDSQDSIDVDDVEFLLGSVASPTAPTPAIPRIRTMGMSSRSTNPAVTPSRSTFLPSRSNLSYVSPAPPSSDNSPFLRQKNRNAGHDRGSIMSWEQLAQHNKSLDDDDMNYMLSEVPAPFRSGTISPILDVPESPTLSALPSPTGYGSISQVLLPEVTPSPAVHNTALLFESGLNEFADAASSTLLRLQLAAAESKAQERLEQIDQLENQLHAAQQARMRDTQELSTQVTELEQKMHETRRTDEQRLNVICSLEDEVRQMQTLRDQAVQKAIARTQEASRISVASALQAHQDKWEVSCVANSTCSAWLTAREIAEAELELVHANRDTLAVLLSSLTQYQSQMAC